MENVRMWSDIMEYCEIGKAENVKAKNIDHNDKNNFDKHNKNDGVQTLHSMFTYTNHLYTERKRVKYEQQSYCRNLGDNLHSMAQNIHC